MNPSSPSEQELSTSHHEDEDAASSVSSLGNFPEPAVGNENSGDNQSQNTQLTLPQQETSASTSKGRFVKIPELNNLFTVLNWDNRNRTSTCNFCGELIKSNRSKRNVDHIQKHCKKISESEKAAFIELSSDLRISNESFDEQLQLIVTKVIINNNAPFKMADCPYFKRLIRFLNKRARVVSRKDISSKYLSQLALNVERTFFNKINQSRNYILSVEFDHWKDISKRLIIGVVLTMVDGTRYLLDLKDVSTGGHFSSVIVATLKNSLNKIPTRYINAFISDSASTCKRAKRDLIKLPEFKHIIVQRCMAHFLNLVGKLFSADRATRATINAAVSVASYASNDSALLAKLATSGLRRVCKSTNVRWYSTVNMLESMLNAREELKQHLKELGARENKARKLARRIVTQSFWAHVFQIIGVMRPLANCIAIAERADGSLGEAMKAMLNFAKSLFKADWNDKFAIAALKAFLSYFNTEKMDSDEIGILIAAYLFDRRYKMDYVATGGKEAVLEAICKLAIRSGYSPDKLNLVLYAEFKSFLDQKAPFNRLATENQTAVQWWSEMPDSGVLKDIAIRLATLKSSSANIERVFSVLKIFQSPVRTNFDIETLRNATRVKLSLAKDEEIYDMYEDLVQHGPQSNEEPGSQSSTSSSSTDNIEEEEDDSPHPRSLSISQPIIPPESSFESQEIRRSSLPTHVVLQVTPSETTFLSAISHKDEEGLKARLDEAYEWFKSFSEWFDFSHVNDLAEPNQNDELDDAQIQAELDEMKRRFRSDQLTR